MRERPILFSPPMVRAIRRKVNPKTVTRRLVKPQPGRFTHVDWDEKQGWHVWWDVATSGIADGYVHQEYAPLRCPYGVPGDRLWVKETFCQGRAATIYRADCCEDRPSANTDDWNAPRVDRWSASIHMPRRLSRLTLEIVSVRAERVQDITEADAVLEGFADREAFLHTFYDLNERAPRTSTPC